MAGRPAKTLTDEQRAQVEALAAYLSQEQIADYFGMGLTTWRSMLEREPEILAIYKKGKAKAVGSIAQSLLTKARNGDSACMMFYLKTQAGWRETNRTEVTGADGADLRPSVITIRAAD